MSVLNLLLFDIMSSKKVELKTNATLLAKEWLEIVYNIRDTNALRYLKWNTITWDNLNTNINEFFQEGYYKVSLNFYSDDTNPFFVKKINNPDLDNTRLYYHTWSIDNPTYWVIWWSWFWYDYKNNWEKTPFGRYVILTGAYLQPEWKNITDNIFKIISVVHYKLWTYEDEVRLESFITNWRK